MKVPALIMAGGKGKRMGLPMEKPLLPFLGKPLVDWVVDAVATAEKVSEFYVVTSPNTPQTEQHCRANGWKILHTKANGYHNDLKQAAAMADLTGPVLTVPADSPAVTGKFLDKIINQFEANGKDFFAVFVPIQKREASGLSIDSTDEYQGVWYAVSGVNVVNGSKIQGEGKIETSALITEETDVLLNINTLKDLEIAEKIMRNKLFESPPEANHSFPSETIKVDLVMWTYNSEKTLQMVLRRIEEVIPRQNIKRKIISDDHSTDETRETAKGLGWEVYLNKGKGLQDNVENAISLVSAPFFCSFEHDIILARDWWHKISKHMENSSVAVAQGVRVSTNPTFRKLDSYSNSRNDIPHETLDNNIARTAMARKFGYNEVGTPPKLAAEGLRWVVDRTAVSDHIRNSAWKNIKHDFRMQSKFPASSKQRLACLRILLTSPLRSAYLAYKTSCPIVLILYPIDRLMIFVATFKRI
jgi:adenosylcobinamide-phosphate guanylyltransferase